MFILITALSLAVSVIVSASLWRLLREERRRSQARVAALTSDLADRDLRPVSMATPRLFRVEETGHSRSRLAAVLAVGMFAVATALALIVVTSRGSQSVSEPRVARAVERAEAGLKPRAATESAPLELVALSHERDGERIIVRGVVRNPTGGIERDRVAVVVFLFNRDGRFLASGRAAVEVPGLAPGAESGFVVTVPHADDVGRYRVSFRSDDRVVPHIDRRDRGPIAQLP